ncbi:MAG: lysylphosphatidylglycerol synthase transmembrane domain-containing protein, partial [Actinomycetota bacterium]|nr:lysylphosphatidylglycerol synthase transmembrane domain-containing protein [Actinomycetota bacterium]
SIAVSAWKWGVITGRLGLVSNLALLVRHYLIGLFFNNVLPTTVGGDVVRAVEHGKASGMTARSAASVVAERLIASVALGLTALIGLAFVQRSALMVGLVLGVLVVTSGATLLFLSPRIAERMVRPLLGSRLVNVAEGVASAVAAVREVLLDRRVLLRVIVLSVGFQTLVALVNVCLFHALGHPSGLAEAMVYTPIVFTITMLPISLSGLGVREAAYAVLFGQAGIPAEVAVTASLAFFVLVALVSLPGAPLFALGRRAVIAS